jgi:hypothetical protein
VTVKKVGVIVGREWSFPPQFIDEVNGRNAGVTAELARLGGTRMDEPVPYAVLEGVTVINNPFMWTADDKFFGASLATRLGLAHPKTLVLPNKDYVPGIVKTESLRNLVYPLDWQAIVDYVGLPCILKDAHGGGWRGVYVCHSTEELIRYYDSSGLLTMIAQEYIKWDRYVRCMCLGQHDVLAMPYDPVSRKYLPDDDHLGRALGQRLVDDSVRLVKALGYDMNTVEWAVRDGVPYAIDFMNPAPDMDVNSLTPRAFDWVVKGMADLVIDRALHPRPQIKEMGWAHLF